MYPSLLLLLLTLAIAQAQAGTYWVDDSCNGKITAGDAVTTETFNFAASAGVRNAKGSADTNQATVFKFLFMVTQSDPTILIRPGMTANDEVQRVMSGIGAMTISTDRDSAEVRIYCDNDETSATGGASARWQLVPDREQDPDGFKNSQRTKPYTQEFYDQYNFVRRTRTSMGCLDDNTLAETFTSAVSSSDPRVRDQNQNRSVITICDLHFSPTFVIKTLSAIPASYNIVRRAKLTGAIIAGLMSRTLLHELMHTPAYGKDDMRGEDGYGWKNIQLLRPREAVRNADTFAFYAIIAGLADRYLRPGPKKSDAAAGNLMRDRAIPQW